MMRQQQVYSESFRRRMVERMSGSRALSATALSPEVGVSQATLSRWLREASKVEEMSSKKSRASRGHGRRRSSERPGEEKVRIVMEAAGLAESELGAFLRREGLHEEDLVRLREEVQAAAVAGLEAKKPRGETEEQRRIKELERDLKRKDAALAETAALLVLRKKAGALWGEEGDDT
jgi:hypothetical protein